MDARAIIDLIIQTGRLLGHLKGAWQTAKQIKRIVDTVINLDEFTSDPGF